MKTNCSSKEAAILLGCYLNIAACMVWILEIFLLQKIGFMFVFALFVPYVLCQSYLFFSKRIYSQMYLVDLLFQYIRF